MGFSEKQVKALRRNLNTVMYEHDRPMVESSHISKAGTQSQRPIGSSASMVGTGRRLKPAVF